VPELRQLRAFVAVAEELNVTRAAERLFLGQQAVSKSVAQLERELGVALLERTTREVRLTVAGLVLLVSGREALAATDAAFDSAQAIGRGWSGTVQVGVSPAIDPATRAEVARVLMADAPDVSVAFREVRPGDVAALLRDRVVDFVIARAAPDAPEVDSASLRPTRVELVVAAGHRLAGASSVRLAELDGERLLTRDPPGTAFTDLLLTRLAAAGAHVEPVQARVVGGGEPLAELEAADAVSVRPAGWPPREGNVYVPIEDDVSLPLLVLWPAGAAPAMVQRVRDGMSSL
jgi:DNA-binding transcriptional LysR family regulator